MVAENRIRLAVLYYGQLKKNQEELADAIRRKERGEAPKDDPVAQARKEASELKDGTNEWLVYLVRNKVASTLIVTMMSQVSEPGFDTSAVGLVKLSKEGVPEDIIAKAMEMMRPAPEAPSPPVTPAKAPNAAKPAKSQSAKKQN